MGTGRVIGHATIQYTFLVNVFLRIILCFCMFALCRPTFYLLWFMFIGLYLLVYTAIVSIS